MIGFIDIHERDEFTKRKTQTLTILLDVHKRESTAIKRSDAF